MLLILSLSPLVDLYLLHASFIVEWLIVEVWSIYMVRRFIGEVLKFLRKKETVFSFDDDKGGVILILNSVLTI